MPKISEVIIQPNKPVLLAFQNGEIQPGEEKSLESALFLDTGTNKKVVGVANGEMIYTGEVQDEDSDLYNNFLAVQQEGSNEIQLIQVDTCTVAPLLQKKTPAKTTPVKQQSLADLRKQFGSKKAKRYTEQQERLTMNIENVTEHLEKTVANIKVTEMPSTLSDANESLYKPKINRGASNKDQVYQLADLVPVEVLDSLEERMLEILESEDIKEYELIPTVEKNIETLRSSLPEKELMSKCKILLYMHYLVKFLVTPLKSMNKKFIACDCSDEVDKHIKENYMVNWATIWAMASNRKDLMVKLDNLYGSYRGSSVMSIEHSYSRPRQINLNALEEQLEHKEPFKKSRILQNFEFSQTRPISMKDKGLCYTIVLLMVAMDHEADLELISKDIKTGLKKMQEFARNLGFSQSTKSKSSITLKIPVPPPVMPNLKRKRHSV